MDFSFEGLVGCFGFVFYHYLSYRKSSSDSVHMWMINDFILALRYTRDI